VFARAQIVLAMLADETALDAVLARGTPRFAELVAGHSIVHMGTTAPQYSRTLAADIVQAGGRYLEAPVSGSRVPAQHGDLVAMVAGDPGDAETVRPLLAPMCRDIIFCGAVPNASTMKLAINLYLITSVTGLTEAMHFAQQHGLDLRQFADVLNGGQVACGARIHECGCDLLLFVVAHGCQAAIWYSCVRPPSTCFRRSRCSARSICGGRA
jgi:3-hydroxyisobutyrate dehydrogenase